MHPKVLVLKCELRPGNQLQTYRHFKALISVCREVSRTSLSNIPEELRAKLKSRGDLTLVNPSKELLRELGVEGFRKGVNYLRLIITEP